MGGVLGSRAWKTAGVLGVVASILSVTSLVVQAFELGLSTPASAMLGYYDNVLEHLLGWAAGPLANVSQALTEWSGLHLQTSPDWKHIFVLSWFYFSIDARSSFLENRRITGTATLLLGAVVSLIAAAASGGTGASATSDLFVALGAVLVGFLFHAVLESLLATAYYRAPGRSTSQSLRYYALTEVLSAVGSGMLALLVAYLMATKGSSRGVVVALGVFVLARGTFWFVRGVHWAVRHGAPGQTWFHRLTGSGSGQFGALFVSIITGVLVFLALNAGL
jgi:hypothetical protein